MVLFMLVFAGFTRQSSYHSQSIKPSILVRIAAKTVGGYCWFDSYFLPAFFSGKTFKRSRPVEGVFR